MVRGTFLQPDIQPFAQRHAALIGQFRAIILINTLMEFFQQCFLRLGGDIMEDGFTVLLVAHHDPSLPAAILTLAHHAVTRRPALCHFITSRRVLFFVLRPISCAAHTLELRSLRYPFFFLFCEGVRGFFSNLPVDATGETVATGEAVEGRFKAEVVLHVHQLQQELPVLLRQPGR